MICAGSFGGEDEGVEENQDLLLGDWGCGVPGIDCGGEFVGFVGPGSVRLGFGVEMGLGLFPSCA